MPSTRKITLMSSDREKFEVEEAVAVESQRLKKMIDDDCTNDVIPLPNVTSKIVAKAMEYCRKRAESRDSMVQGEDLRAWDTEFIKVDQATLLDLTLAADYLNIKGLLDLTCQAVADMIRGKRPEEIRSIFKIKSDFAPGEEEEIRRQNVWVFE